MNGTHNLTMCFQAPLEHNYDEAQEHSDTDHKDHQTAEKLPFRVSHKLNKTNFFLGQQ